MSIKTPFSSNIRLKQYQASLPHCILHTSLNTFVQLLPQHQFLGGRGGPAIIGGRIGIAPIIGPIGPIGPPIGGPIGGRIPEKKEILFTQCRITQVIILN